MDVSGYKRLRISLVLDQSTMQKSVLDNITKVCKDADVLVSATDLDREGSSIFLEIYKYLSDMLGKGFSTPELKRMEVSSLTDKEIKSAWSNLKDYDWGRSYAGFYA